MANNRIVRLQTNETDVAFGMSNKDSISHVLSVEGLDDVDKEAILGGTAARLLGIS